MQGAEVARPRIIRTNTDTFGGRGQVVYPCPEIEIHGRQSTAVLLRFQRLQRVHSHCSAGRDVARDRRDHSDRDDHGRESESTVLVEVGAICQ